MYLPSEVDRGVKTLPIGLVLKNRFHKQVPIRTQIAAQTCAYAETLRFPEQKLDYNGHECCNHNGKLVKFLLSTPVYDKSILLQAD